MGVPVLPNTSKADGDPNLFSEVVANDQAIVDELDGGIDNDNIANNTLNPAKIKNQTAGKILLANASGVVTGTAVTGDVTISDTGVTTLGGDAAEAAGISSGGTVRRGNSIIATEESRSNTSYGTLTTADQVDDVVLPTDGLIVVAFQAQFKSSVNNAGRAAIFIGSNQLQARAGALAVQETTSEVANTYYGLGSSSGGLSTDGTSASGSDATTGQLVGAGSEDGACFIFAAAGTYDVSIRFKATSGSVTAKERKLWVWTMGF